MELRHLRYFVAVAEELNFTRAAERLHMAQPPLSTQIRALEEELGVRLLERDRRRVYLTQAGRQFLLRARAVLDDVRQAREEARSAAAGDAGRLDLGYTASSVMTSVLPAAIRRYREERPAIELRMREMTSLHQVDAIHARELDVGVLRRPNVNIPRGVVVEEWHSAPLVAAVPEQHVLTRGRGIHMRELRDVPLIVFPRESGIGLYWTVQELCSRAGFRPRVLHEAQDPSTMVGLVACGLGVAIVPEDVRAIALPGVLYCRILDREAVSSLFLGYRADNEDPHLVELLTRLRAAAGRRGRARE